MIFHTEKLLHVQKEICTKILQTFKSINPDLKTCREYKNLDFDTWSVDLETKLSSHNFSQKMERTNLSFYPDSREILET